MREHRSVVDFKRLALLAVVALTVAGAWWAVSGLISNGNTPAGSQTAVQVQAASVMEPPRALGQEALNVGIEEGDLAPDFEASNLEGERFLLSDYRGQAVLINFWAIWCTPCKAEMPAMQTVLDERRGDGFAIVAVNMGDTRERAERFMEDLQVDFDEAMDPELGIAKRYRVVGLPTSVFVDRDGVLRRYYVGQMSLEMIKTFVLELLDATAQSTAGGTTVPAAASVAPAPAAGLAPPAGEPAILLVTPEVDGPDSVLLQSPSLRCAADFCAGYLLQDLRTAPGITYANSRVVDEATGDWGFLVKYDSARLTVDDVVMIYQRSLRERPDPLYPAPHQVVMTETDPN